MVNDIGTFQLQILGNFSKYFCVSSQIPGEERENSLASLQPLPNGHIFPVSLVVSLLYERKHVNIGRYVVGSNEQMCMGDR